MHNHKPIITPEWLAYGFAVLSGLLFIWSMPGTGAGLLAWIAFVPLLLAVNGRAGKSAYFLFNITGIIGSIGIHIWFPDVLGTGLGLFLMIAAGFLYGALLQFGCDLQHRFRSPLRVFILPAVWTALEWLRSVLPVTREWWIEVLAKSQWTSPAPLQIVSLTGFAGLSFLIMLANSALANLIIEWSQRRRLSRKSLAALALPVAAAVWGWTVVAQPPQAQPIRAAANTDLVNQDPAVQRLGGQTSAGDGYIADTPEMSRAIFEINAELTRQADAQADPSFIVWGENEFADYDEQEMIGNLRELAASTGAYIAADVTWRSGDGLHDTALLVGPDGEEIGKTAKINLTGGEEAYGFVPGTRIGQVYETEYGKVGLAVCWDRHTTGIIRSLARNGAGLVLIPVDDDFNGNPVFPRYAASDSVFRAVENRVAIVVGSTSGMSQIITPYGVMSASSPVNKRGFITGETYLPSEPGTLYTRWGDWFGWTVAAFVLAILGWQFRKRKS